MAERKPFRADDKRRSGAGDNVRTTVHDTDGAGPRVVDMSVIFNDRRLFSGKNGKGKKVF
jgi:hypothetical protein